MRLFNRLKSVGTWARVGVVAAGAVCMLSGVIWAGRPGDEGKGNNQGNGDNNGRHEGNDHKNVEAGKAVFRFIVIPPMQMTWYAPTE